MTTMHEMTPLTPRQREVLKLIAEGLLSKEIAAELGVSLKTVDTHRTELMRRLGIRGIAGLVRYAVRVGLIHLDPLP
jgi:DNA-binding CsgD family transcriptional regulator